MVTTRERALDAALELLGEQGIRALTHARVDERAGLPKGSTSNWFRTRDALVAGIAGGAVAQDASAVPGGTPMAMPSGPAPTSLTVLCTPQEDWCQAMVAAFSAETGIPTTYVRLSSGEALARLRAGAAAPEFSVWWGGPADGFVAAHDGVHRSFALGLQASDAYARVVELAREPLRFELSLRVLAGGAIAFAFWRWPRRQSQC